MDSHSLIRMANDIGAFFAHEPTPQEAAQGVYVHFKRFWDPRMKSQIIDVYRAGGEGLADHVRAAVALLAEDKP
jgi:formate dehydrogenase subunit delta